MPGKGAYISVAIGSRRVQRFRRSWICAHRRQRGHGHLPDVGMRVGHRGRQGPDGYDGAGRRQRLSRAGANLPCGCRPSQHAGSQGVQRGRAAERSGRLEGCRPDQDVGIARQPFQRRAGVRVPSFGQLGG